MDAREWSSAGIGWIAHDGLSRDLLYSARTAVEQWPIWIDFVKKLNKKKAQRPAGPMVKALDYDPMSNIKRFQVRVLGRSFLFCWLADSEYATMQSLDSYGSVRVAHLVSYMYYYCQTCCT